ncbi:RagB/SusD family nutrient uptake outer membrane protein [Pedobacter heparinus]|uniref:RagB/SusD domain protein n=1 Tax=Pedobacter heparinus (strain ATCC 13125 / DSM 2366 / CIP 104194 / JCM 7457 / NBRC 12017 / NCIMB 9290 / NRRL B-14731 / HIM 762-3) TaxID=485917 RepID=C6XWC0_PEDHD|nr:RagB/SusD family nutrient uptake outer membrane protein [Pedobacter heparinus]ACU04199.1 hypothetical protein Phep_1992 [Pedobacter heparinus DSM 2366]
MKHKFEKLFFFSLIFSTTLCSCNKFLEEKPDISMHIPSTISDFQALLDQGGIWVNDPGLLEILAGDYYVNSSSWQNLNSADATNHIWASDAVPNILSWNLPYQFPIYYSNIVLDQLASSQLNEDINYKQIHGTALFYRANAFFTLAQVFAKPYDASTLSDLGIVLRTTSDANAKSTRATIGTTYDKILTDLKKAAELLPESSIIQTRPTKSAAYASLARVYLMMRDYNNALQYSNLVLQKSQTLLDFNGLTGGVPIVNFNNEVIYFSRTRSEIILSQTNAKISETLLNLYTDIDLRKRIFFRPNTGINAGTFAFRGSYGGSQFPGSVFTGTTTGEMLLIRAECFARIDNKVLAIKDINTLLAKRMDKTKWSPIDPSTVTDPLSLVLAERRKELVFRGLRWMDVRRLNMEGANITLKRQINGIEYTLPPNDPRGVALIPFDVINRAGIPQNPR